MKIAITNLKTIVKEIADEMAERTDRGEVANYIPELANVHNKRFGLVEAIQRPQFAYPFQAKADVVRVDR